jgi:hypothetical protein
LIQIRGPALPVEQDQAMSGGREDSLGGAQDKQSAHVQRSSASGDFLTIGLPLLQSAMGRNPTFKLRHSPVRASRQMKKNGLARYGRGRFSFLMLRQASAHEVNLLQTSCALGMPRNALATCQ